MQAAMFAEPIHQPRFGAWGYDFPTLLDRPAAALGPSWATFGAGFDAIVLLAAALAQRAGRAVDALAINTAEGLLGAARDYAQAVGDQGDLHGLMVYEVTGNMVRHLAGTMLAEVHLTVDGLVAMRRATGEELPTLTGGIVVQGQQVLAILLALGLLHAPDGAAILRANMTRAKELAQHIVDHHSDAQVAAVTAATFGVLCRPVEGTPGMFWVALRW